MHAYIYRSHKSKNVTICVNRFVCNQRSGLEQYSTLRLRVSKEWENVRPSSTKTKKPMKNGWKKNEAFKRQYALLWTSSRSYSLMFSSDFFFRIFPSKRVFFCRCPFVPFVLFCCIERQEHYENWDRDENGDENEIISSNAIYLGTGQKWTKLKNEQRFIMKIYRKLDNITRSYDGCSSNCFHLIRPWIVDGWSTNHFNLQPNQRWTWHSNISSGRTH